MYFLGESFLSQIQLLPHLIPPKSRVKVGKKQWKFSVLEALAGIYNEVQV